MDYETEILKALLNKQIITEELYEKCSKPHLQGLPSLNTSNMDELQKRLDMIDSRIDTIREENEHIKEDIVR